MQARWTVRGETAERERASSDGSDAAEVKRRDERQAPRRARTQGEARGEGWRRNYVFMHDHVTTDVACSSVRWSEERPRSAGEDRGRQSFSAIARTLVQAVGIYPLE